MKLRRGRSVHWISLVVFCGIFAGQVEGQNENEASKPTETSGLEGYESVIATVTFLVFAAGFLACIWCSCCLDELYATTTIKKPTKISKI